MSWLIGAMSRSLKVRSEFIPTVKSSLLRNGFPSQKILAEDLGIAQSTVSNFLNGKPVDYANFLEICQVLGQEWRNIADLETQIQPNLTVDVRVKVLICDRTHQSTLPQQLQQAFTAAGHEIIIPQTNTQFNHQAVPFNSQSLHLCDYLLLLLSEQSAVSEILLEQVQLAQELHNTVARKPAILPICLDLPWRYTLPFDLLQLLQGIQPWQWRCSDETSQLIAQLLRIFIDNRTSLPADSEFALHWHNLTDQKSSEFNSFSPPQNFLPPLPVASPELPEGQVELTSHFYIERPPIEARCYETIIQPGALIRIKAPRQMGKTSLMARILQHAQQQGSITVALSFQLANKRVFANSDTFLQWFCASIGQELGKLDQLVNCWQLADMIGSNQCCKAFFDQYLLPELDTSITLGLDEVDRVFESPEIADDFFGLLRALHEEAKRSEIWKKFRLIVVHSTEVYIPLDINKSPFNVGLPIELPEFNAPQVQELAQRHGLDWQETEVKELMALVGGHPYLVRLAMYYIARQDMTLMQVLKAAATEAGIYSDHLRRHLWNLEKYPEMKLAMQEVVTASQPIRLRSEQAFKLNSMGLVKLDGNVCKPRCDLYDQYFHEVLRE